MRQEIGELADQVDAHVLVGDADMDMHAADQHPPRHPLQVAGEAVVAFALGMGLPPPFRERMARGGDGGEVVARRHLGDGAAQPAQIGAGLADGVADPGADLDLALQEFRADLAFERVGAVGDQLRRRLRQLKLSRSTRRYSSSMPMVKSGASMRCPRRTSMRQRRGEA